MAPVTQKRRRVEDEVRPKKKVRKFKKQAQYHSSSEDDDSEDESAIPRQQRASDAPRAQPKFSMKAVEAKPQTKIASRPKSILKQAPAPKEPSESEDEEDEEDESDNGVELDELEKNTALNAMQQEDSEEDEDMEEDDKPDLEGGSEDDDDDEEHDIPSDSEASMTSSQAARSKKKRNDPSAFATSISKILDTKLTTAKRQDPVLSRSKSAAEANRQLADSKLEQKARAQIRAEKKQALEKGRVKDVLGLQTPNVDTGAIMEEEKRLKKTAQRGVVRLFNAVRAAQVKAEEAMKEAKAQGVVGMQKREEKVNEMSKQGFLDLISSGGKQKAAAAS